MVRVPGGTVTLLQLPQSNGTYVPDTVVSLEATPRSADFTVVWSGVDSYRGTQATVRMVGERSVRADIELPLSAPTPTPGPPPTPTPTPPPGSTPTPTPTLTPTPTPTVTLAQTVVNVVSISASPSTAGDITELTIQFITNKRVTAGSGQIIVRFDKNWGIPISIAKERVALTTQHPTGGTSNPAVDPTITWDPTTGNVTVAITIGDTVPGGDVQHLDAQAAIGNTLPHILVFSRLAGLQMPVVSAAAAVNWISVETTAEGPEATVPTTGSYGGDPAGVAVQRSITLSPTSGTSGSVVTVTGKGFASGGTATIYLDANGDGMFTIGDIILATSESVISGGLFTATFTVTVPRFSVGGNSINAFDGTGLNATAILWTLIG